MGGRVLVWIAACGVAAALLLFARHAYPTPGTDAPSFLATAIDHRLGRGFVNPFYPQMAYADPTGARRHIYYPPLFPLAVGALMRRATAGDAFLAVGLLRSASILLASALLLRIACAGRAPLAASTAALIALCLCGLATNWLPTLGRPEALATLLVIVAALGALRLSGPALAVFLGIMTGLVAATQPFGALELAAVIGLSASVRESPRTALAVTTAVAGIGLVIFASALALSPHGLSATLLGMAHAYPYTPWSAPPGEQWWKPWLTARRSTFYGPLLLIALACGTHLLVRRGGVRARLPFTLFVLALAIFLYLGSLTHHSRRNYNALLLSPLLFAVVVHWFVASREWAARWTRLGRAACLACVLATAVGFVGYLIALPWFVTNGRGLAAARADWRSVPFPPGARIVLMGNLWALTEDYDRIELLSASALGEVMRRRPVPLLVLGQRPEHRGAPPPLSGFVLLREFFNPRWQPPPLLAPFLEEDYAFAVYVPASSAGGATP